MLNRNTLVVSTQHVEPTWRDVPIIRTMLDLISSLERMGETIETIVLGGEFALDDDLAAFLRETYPSIDVVFADEQQRWV